MTGFIVFSIGVLLLMSLIMSLTDGRLARDRKSDNPTTRRKAEEAVLGIFILGVLCLLFFTWPLVVTIGIIYLFYKTIKLL